MEARNSPARLSRACGDSRRGQAERGALKFRRPGVAPKVAITGRTAGQFAEIDVVDNGIGFDPAYNTRIFRVFERLHGRTAYPGTGIGLALCQKVLERHGGTITAEGTPGMGAKFTVTLPMVRVEQSRRVDAPERDVVRT